MHLRSLSLRNYRVYREADIDFPDGLIGVYGPNGSGKSSLIEAVRYALYGDARTDKWELRSAGINEDVRVELVFEHEGNSYQVRRVLKGRNLTPSVEVLVNSQVAVQSAREANAYLARVLGMDQRAFLASVCAQQKELTTFATMIPTERRRLVLDLLGVSPIERVLAGVREESREAKAVASAARAQLPDLPAAEAGVAEAAAELQAADAAARAAGEAAEAARAALATAEDMATRAEAAARRLGELRQQAALRRAEAASHRREAERHERRAAEADALGPRIAAAETRLGELADAAAPLDDLERAREAQLERQGLLRLLADAGKREQVARRALAEATRDLSAADIAGVTEAIQKAEAVIEKVEAALLQARERHATASEVLGASAARLEAAAAAARRYAGLDAQAPCPTCGQPLGEAFSAVAARHAEELATAKAAHDEAVRLREAAVAEGHKLAARRAELKGELERARAAQQRATRAATLVASAEQAIAVVSQEVAERERELERHPDPGFDLEAHRRAKQAAEELQRVALDLRELRGRAEQAEVERKLAKEALDRAAEADERAAAVEAEAGTLGEAERELAAAREHVRQAAELCRATHGEQQRAAEALAGARRRHADRERELAAARARHEEVAALEEQAAYLARLVDLMAAFRLHLVARLGRRLSVEAAGLFAELTDHEYQDLVVDPEDYSIRIADAGTEHELARFSGSENDLASLSLRVAVSLVIAEGAGELGLLVLDEVLGSLDRERRGRMLAALTTLQGRFRQVLLVTHNDEVKDLLPAAIEVRKGPNRTSMAVVRS
jgi:DNA repair protein SbcC/Rad50